MEGYAVWGKGGRQRQRGGIEAARDGFEFSCNSQSPCGEVVLREPRLMGLKYGRHAH